MRPGALETGEEGVCFFPELGVERRLLMMLSVVLTWSRTEMGEIMIVWCSGGAQNGERYWVIHYSEAGSPSNRTPAKTQEPNCDDLCLSPHQNGWCIIGITETLFAGCVYKEASCCARSVAHVLRRPRYPLDLNKSWFDFSWDLEISLFVSFTDMVFFGV